MQKKILQITLAVLLLASHCLGMTFKKYDMNTGLCHNSVLCVTQTRDGFIWIGTRDGLCRFNGNTYTVFKQRFDDKNSISNNSINCLYEAKNGDLWIGTTMGLNRYSYKTELFQKYTIQTDGKGLSHNYIRSINETGEGEILVGTPSGIDIFDPGTNSFRNVPIEKRLSGKQNSITCFYQDSRGRMLVGSRTGLYIFGKGGLVKIPLSEKVKLKSTDFEIRDIKEDVDGKIWLATHESGILIVTVHSDEAELNRQYHVGNSDIISNQVRKLFFNEKEVWIGTMEGLTILNREKKSFSNYQYALNSPEGISNNSIRDIFGDNQGGIWLATYAGGINYYHRQNNLFPHFEVTSDVDNIQIANVVAGLLEKENGDLYIATEGGGLILQKFSNKKTSHYLFQAGKNSLIHNNVKSIDQDKKGNLWIGTFNGLSYLDHQTNRFINYQNQPDNSNSLVYNQVHSVVVDKDGLVWIGTNGSGVQILDPVTSLFRSVPIAEAKNVNVIMADHNNRLWIGHQAGLVCIDKNSLKKVDLTPFLEQLSLAPQYVQSLYEDHLGRIWIGTQGFGLFLIHKDKIFSFNTDDGLPNSTINGVVEDDAGQFWVSSNKGLSRVIISETEGKIPQLAVKTFTKDQGLQGFQYMPMSFFKTKTGELYFGGVDGYNKFKPSSIQVDDFFPTIMISDLSVRAKNKEGIIHWPLKSLTSEKEEISLNYQYRDISVDFWGINFIDPGNTFFRYRLLNFDNGWINLGTQHTINFSFLPAGKYQLQLQATTNPGKWDTKFQSLEFTILPPWWMTFWAFSGYLILLILLLTIFFRLSKRWVNLTNQLAMEHLHREKEEELHQMKLKFFTDVSHELRTPLTLIVSPLEQIIKQPDLNSRLRNQLTLIQLNGARMMRLINKVLDLRRLDAGHDRLQAAEGEMVKFLKEISLAFKETANIKNIEFSFESEESILPLYFDRDKMEMILYNLLSNAIKNTPENGKITLKLKLSEATAYPGFKSSWLDGQRFAVISVADTGRGIPADLLDRIFERFFVSSSKERRFPLDSGVGLELTKRLVELHKGHITVESQEKTAEKEGYSCFSVLFPLGKDHLAEEEMIAGFKNSEDSSLYTISMMANEIQNESSPAPDLVDLPGKLVEPKGKLTLLVVEDNTEVRTFIKSLFTGQYTVEEAGNGKEGLGKATEIIPDLIICDIMMPEMDGIELCKRIKTDIRTSHIPVILLTARTAITFKYEGLETGADDYITKPFSAEYLKLRVQKLIRQRSTLTNLFTHEMICDPAKITITSVDEKLLKKAVDYIGENMSDSSLSVERLSSELGLSRVHLYRKIKAFTGLTAVEFIRSLRLKRASSLLQENKLNINEISKIVGFEDVDYFRSCFKQQFGHSPSDYSKIFRN